MNPLTFVIVLLLQVIRFILMAVMSLTVMGLTLLVAPLWAVYRVLSPKKWKYDPNRE